MRELAASRQALVNAALVTTIPNLVIAVLVRQFSGSRLLAGMFLGHSLLAAAILAAAWGLHKPKRSWIAVADVLLFAPYFVTISASISVLGTLADPLFASKLLAIGLATIVPSSFRLHLVLMGGLAFQAAALWLSLPSEGVSPAEPWATGLFFMTAGWFLVARWRQRAFAREIEELRIQAEALTQVAKIFVAVRHLANTPLQKLALVASMLRQGAPITPERLDALDAAVADLKALLAEFRRYEGVIEQSAQEVSFDAQRELARLLPESAPQAARSRSP